MQIAEFINDSFRSAPIFMAQVLLGYYGQYPGGFMNPMDFQDIPKCTFEHPFDLTPSEISSLTHHINILLKSTFLIGISKDIEGTFQSLFDIAEEIAGVECCAYLSEDPASGQLETVVSRHIPPKTGQDPSLFTPGGSSRHFGKVIQMDS